MIGQITKENIPECAELIRLSFSTVAREHNITPENAPRYTAFATTEERLNRQLEEGRVMTGYFSGGRLVGYYSLCMDGEGGCELNNLCVHPEMRHNGIGAQLLESAFSEASKAGCMKMNIGIVEENTLLRRWYETHGFVHIGTQKFDFFPFTCGYMEKTLTVTSESLV